MILLIYYWLKKGGRQIYFGKSVLSAKDYIRSFILSNSLLCHYNIIIFSGIKLNLQGRFTSASFYLSSGQLSCHVIVRNTKELR